jgi:hypothetical protein
LIDVLRIDGEKAIDSLLEARFELAHPLHQVEVEVRRQQAKALVGPREGDLVEVLPDLACQRSQVVQLVCTAQELLVVASGALVRSVLIGDITADLAVVFDGGPDADVDGREHSAFGNHCSTSR